MMMTVVDGEIILEAGSGGIFERNRKFQRAEVAFMPALEGFVALCKSHFSTLMQHVITHRMLKIASFEFRKFSQKRFSFPPFSDRAHHKHKQASKRSR